MTKLPLAINHIGDALIMAQGQHAQVQENANEEHLTIMWTFGMNMVEDAAYQKGAHGQGAFYERIIDYVKRRNPNCPASSTYLHNAAMIYESFPNLGNLHKQLETAGKRISVNSTLHLISESSTQKTIKAEKQPSCRHCEIHCKRAEV